MTADAGGDLTRITVDACGEILDFKETVNGTTEFLCMFTDEVARLTRTIGSEGCFGRQARVNVVGGIWRGLTTANVGRSMPGFFIVFLKEMTYIFSLSQLSLIKCV